MASDEYLVLFASVFFLFFIYCYNNLITQLFYKQVIPLLNQLTPYSTSAFQRFGVSTSDLQQDDKKTNKHTDDGVNRSVGASTEA